MIEPLNLHYSFTNPASIHDEEALTALELAGRQGAKINEVVKDQNALRQETETHLAEQDKTIDDRMDLQDLAIEKIRSVTVPADVTAEVQKQINNGTFDHQIDESLNNLNERVDNLLGKVVEGSTTGDAELIDMRVDWKGREWNNAGQSFRTVTEELYDNGICTPLVPSHFQGIFADIDESVKAKTARVKMTPTGNGSGGLYVSYYGLGKAGKTYSFTLDFPGDFTLYVRTHTDGLVYGNTATFDFLHKNGNVVKFQTKEDFNVIILNLGVTSGEIDIRFSLVENTEPSYVLPQQISENLTGFSHYISDIIWYGLLSDVTYNNSRNGGLFVHDLTYTPNEGNTTHAMVTQYPFKVGVPYQIIMQGVHPKDISGFYYGTHASWGVGEFATRTYSTSYNEESKTMFLDFIITNNDVGAESLIVRFSNIAESLNIRVGVMELYEKSKITEGKEYLAFCGDSLTAQQYFTFIDTTKTKMGFGVGGEGITGIFHRTGVEPLYVESESILPGRNQIVLSDVGLFAQGMGNINPVTIAGIEGTLERTDGLYYFTPSEEIEETPVYRPLVVPYQSTLNVVQYVFWVGTNNLGSWTTEQIFEAWEKVLAVYPNSIILGLTNDSSDTALEKVLALDELGKKLGNRFVPLHDWLVNYGLSYCGLTPTEDDNVAISAGKIPPQLLSDKVHFNDYGKKCVSYLVSERLKVFNVL